MCVLRYSHVCKRLPLALRERAIGATLHPVMHLDWFESLKRGEQVLRDVSRRHPDAWVAPDDDEDHQAALRWAALFCWT